MAPGDGEVVHLDTDLGGDPDDACALAMLLEWPDVRLGGITTAIDTDGERAGCVAHHPGGSLTQIVADVDGESFSDAWIEAVEAAQKDG